MPEITRGLWRYRADAQRVVIGGSLSDGGSVFAWLKRLARLPEDPAEAERAIAAMAPDAHGLTVLPLLSGERGPGWSDAAGATIAGLTPATEPLDLLRAGLEAVALRFRLIELELSEALPGERDVVGTGGGLVKSPAWTQIMADALGRPVAMSEVEEGSSRGAALLALEALGHLERAEEVEAPLGETYEPDPERTRGLPGRAGAPAGALRRRHIDAGAATPSRPSARAMTRWAATLSAIRKSSSEAGSAPTTWQSR